MRGGREEGKTGGGGGGQRDSGGKVVYVGHGLCSAGNLILYFYTCRQSTK